MTWSITRSKIVGGQPIVLWDETPLRRLGADGFVKAANAAQALGEVVCLDATELKPGLAVQAARADLIVKAVIAEMERRGVEEVGASAAEAAGGNDNVQEACGPGRATARTSSGNGAAIRRIRAGQDGG